MSISSRIQKIIDDLCRGNISEFSKRLGIGHSTVHNYLKGRDPSTEFVTNAFKSLNINPNWLLIGEGEMLYGGDTNVSDIKKPEENYDLNGDWTITARARRAYPFMKELVDSTNKSAEMELPADDMIRKSKNLLDNALIDYEHTIKKRTKSTG